MTQAPIAGGRRMWNWAALASATGIGDVAAQTAAEAAPETAPDILRIAFCGDSLAQGLFLTLQPVLRQRSSFQLINGTRHATGLTRSDEHDWPVAIRALNPGMLWIAPR